MPISRRNARFSFIGAFRVFALVWLISVAALSASAQATAPQYATMKRVLEYIPMKDGVRLAVTLYMPEGANPDETFPAILEELSVVS